MSRAKGFYYRIKIAENIWEYKKVICFVVVFIAQRALMVVAVSNHGRQYDGFRSVFSAFARQRAYTSVQGTGHCRHSGKRLRLVNSYLSLSASGSFAVNLANTFVPPLYRRRTQSHFFFNHSSLPCKPDT